MAIAGARQDKMAVARYVVDVSIPESLLPCMASSCTPFYQFKAILYCILAKQSEQSTMMFLSLFLNHLIAICGLVAFDSPWQLAFVVDAVSMGRVCLDQMDKSTRLLFLTNTFS